MTNFIVEEGVPISYSLELMMVNPCVSHLKAFLWVILFNDSKVIHKICIVYYTPEIFTCPQLYFYIDGITSNLTIDK